SQDHVRVGARLLPHRAIRPSIDRATALEVDVWAQDGAEAPRTGHRLGRRRSGSLRADEELLDLGTECPQGRGIRTTGPGRGPSSRRPILLVEPVERWTLDDHRVIEPPDQDLQVRHGDVLAGFPQQPRLDLNQVRLAIELADDVEITV